MKPRGIKALIWGVFLCTALVGCATTKKAVHRKPAPTPAERLALKQYRMGIDAYANTRYSEAISHWKVTLANDPTDATNVTGNAAVYIGRAEAMLKASKDAKALPPMVSKTAAP